MDFKKLANLIIGVIIGTLIIGSFVLYAPLITVGSEVRKQIREEARYLNRNLRGQRLFMAVEEILDNPNYDGEFDEIYVENDNGTLIIEAIYYYPIQVFGKTLHEISVDIVIDNVQLNK